MNEFSEYYIAVEEVISYLKPEIVRLAEIWIEITDDIPVAVKKWARFGFVQLDLDNDSVQELASERSEFTKLAATLGASLVIYRPWPSPPEPVFFAPKSAAAREQAEFELRPGGATVLMPEKRSFPPTQISPIVYKAVRLSQQGTYDLSTVVSNWQERGFVMLGTSDAVEKNDDMGVFERLYISAIDVGASLLCFQITPAKARTIRRNTDGRIDMDAIVSDSPTKAYPRGTSVIQAAFLAPMSHEARELGKLDQKIATRYIRLELE